MQNLPPPAPSGPPTCEELLTTWMAIEAHPILLLAVFMLALIGAFTVGEGTWRAIRGMYRLAMSEVRLWKESQ